MKKIFLITIFFAFLLSCTQSVRYTEKEIADFPPEIKELIRNGKVGFGMTPEQVRYAMGSPSDIRVLEVSLEKNGGDKVQWTYKRYGVYTTRLIFKKDKLIEIISNDPDVKKHDR
ncbi:MAG: outer membrane protein assembly factor BamE [Nitrospirae bacterium YQR-1]